MDFGFRTDLASEAKLLWERSSGETSALSGVRAWEERLFDFDVTAVEILDNEGSRALGKPVGKYFTLELPQSFDRSSERFADCVHAAAELLSRCAETRPQSALVAALGNPDITPDALGSLTAGYTLVTRHMKEKLPHDFAAFSSLALCRTGVLGTSGIESAAHIKLLADNLHPELVIVVDALAGAESERLCRTVQFTNTGISPGSGVGNDRDELSEKSLGVPVVAIGMPTVIDAGRLGNGMGGMFVTPRNIDAVVRAAAKIIGYAINVAVHDICVEDIDMML